MGETYYKDIKDAIIYSKLYEGLSDKIDNTNLKHRSVNTFILANLCVGFSKEFGLDPALSELIVHARDIAYPNFGDVTYSFLIKKSEKFNKSDYTLEILENKILKPSNLELPEALKQGIISSFNVADRTSKEGRLIYLLEKTIYTAQMKTENAKAYTEYNSKLEEIWNNLSSKGLSTADIVDRIISLTDTMISNNIV